jgi:hypothetical protein
MPKMREDARKAMQERFKQWFSGKCLNHKSLLLEWTESEADRAADESALAVLGEIRDRIRTTRQGARSQRDTSGKLTPLALALEAIEGNGCDCGTDEPGTCLACRCEDALDDLLTQITVQRDAEMVRDLLENWQCPACHREGPLTTYCPDCGCPQRGDLVPELGQGDASGTAETRGAGDESDRLRGLTHAELYHLIEQNTHTLRARQVLPAPGGRVAVSRRGEFVPATVVTEVVDVEGEPGFAAVADGDEDGEKLYLLRLLGSTWRPESAEQGQASAMAWDD